MLLSNIWICGFMSNLYKKSWLVSNAAASATKMSRWNELYSGWSLCSGSTLFRTFAVWIREFVARNIYDPTPYFRKFPSPSHKQFLLVYCICDGKKDTVRAKIHIDRVEYWLLAESKKNKKKKQPKAWPINHLSMYLVVRD